MQSKHVCKVDASANRQSANRQDGERRPAVTATAGHENVHVFDAEWGSAASATGAIPTGTSSEPSGRNSNYPRFPGGIQHGPQRKNQSCGKSGPQLSRGKSDGQTSDSVDRTPRFMRRPTAGREPGRARYRTSHRAGSIRQTRAQGAATRPPATYLSATLIVRSRPTGDRPRTIRPHRRLPAGKF